MAPTLGQLCCRYARVRRRQKTDLPRPRSIWLSRLSGAAAADDVADSILRIADRGGDGARAVGATDDDDVGFAWWGRREGEVGGERSEVPGGRQSIANSAALTLRAWLQMRRAKLDHVLEFGQSCIDDRVHSSTRWT